MKAFIQALLIVLMIAATAAGYVIVQRDYFKKLDLDQNMALSQAESAKRIAFLEQQVTELRGQSAEIRDKALASLGTVEASLAALRLEAQQLREESKSLGELKAAINELQQSRNNYVDKNELQGKLAETLKSLNQSFPVNINLGSLPAGKNKDVTYKIPADIPDTAREILIYVYIATNYVKGGSHNFKIAVQLNETMESAFYLRAIATAQQAWSYNSDNVWLPMPANRELKLQSDGDALFGSWDSAVKIIAYR